MTAEQQAALAARLAQQDMQGLAEWQAADALNAPGSGAGTTWQDVPTSAIYRRLLIDDAPGANVSAWGLIELNARRNATTAFNTAASAPSVQDQMISHLTALVRWVQGFPTVDATDADVRARFGAIFGALVTGGWVSSATRDTIVALAQRPASWAEAAGWSRAMTSRDVGLARGGVA